MPDPSSPAPPAPWSRPRGLLLDAMGTLIGLQRPVGSSYAAVAAEHGISLDAEAADAAFRQVLSQAPPLAFGSLEPDALLRSEQEWWGGADQRNLQPSWGPRTRARFAAGPV